MAFRARHLPRCGRAGQMHLMSSDAPRRPCRVAVDILWRCRTCRTSVTCDAVLRTGRLGMACRAAHPRCAPGKLRTVARLAGTHIPSIRTDDVAVKFGRCRRDPSVRMDFGASRRSRGKVRAEVGTAGPHACARKGQAEEGDRRRSSSCTHVSCGNSRRSSFPEFRRAAHSGRCGTRSNSLPHSHAIRLRRPA